LRDHLLWQLNLTPMSERDLAIARDHRRRSDGMLIATVEEILGFPSRRGRSGRSRRGAQRIQQFDPPASRARLRDAC
jgi:DNA-directed RNA polymerase specialized sigma54-like protein